MVGNLYLLLLKNHPSGAARMLDSLATGYDELPAAVARFGGTVNSVFALTGRYDAALLVDFSERTSLAAFVLTATAQGQSVEVLQALNRDEVGEAERVAREASEAFVQEVAAAIPDDAQESGRGD